MVAKFCSRSHGQPRAGSRKRAMIAMRRSIGVPVIVQIQGIVAALLAARTGQTKLSPTSTTIPDFTRDGLDDAAVAGMLYSTSRKAGRGGDRSRHGARGEDPAMATP